ncbi:MAG: hypothetical protein K6G76_01760 [Lachnospiraceae bacterium]|nr:hypothetical protein [Lachnospiraceae bacterium]
MYKHSSIKKILSVVLVMCSIILFGCGNTDVVTDYGDEQNADESGKMDDVKPSVSTSGASIREMIGTDSIEYYDNFAVDGIPVEVNVKCQVPDIPSVSAYQLTRVGDGKVNEEQIVKALFGETAKELSEIDTSEDYRDSKYLGMCDEYHSIVEAMGIDLFVDFDPSKFEKVDEEDYNVQILPDDEAANYKWIDEEDYFIHLYQGAYEGVDYGLIYAYSYKYETLYISFVPITLENYFEDEKYVEYSGYHQDENSGEETSFGASNKQNECNMTDDEIINTANDFLCDKLMLEKYDDMLSFYDDTGEKIYGKSKTGIGFYKSFDGPQSAFDRLDGYELYITQKKSGLLPSAGKVSDDAYYRDFRYSTGYVLSNAGRVHVTSRGILSVSLSWQVDVTDVTDNVTLLNGDSIKKCFRSAVENNIERNKMGTRRQLYFNKLDLRYYPVRNPDDDNEFTYVPAWEFTATAQARTEVIVYINAIDGELIDVVY